MISKWKPGNKTIRLLLRRTMEERCDTSKMTL